MTAIPYDGVMPPLPLPADGYATLIMLLGIASAVVVFGMMLWAIRGTVRRRERINCPVQLRPARVLFALGPGYARRDIVRCSLFGRRRVTCGKVCLHTPTRA